MTETTPAVPAIYASMLAVKAGIGTLAKTGVGPSSQGSYAFLKYDDILEKIKDEFAKNQILVVPRLISHETTMRHAESLWTMGNADKGIAPQPVHDGKVPNVSVREWVEMEYCFISAVDGSSLVATISGEAFDSQDKASRKAHTSAYKSALIIVFDIVTGEPDPDGINPDDANRAATTDRREGGDRGNQQRQAAATAGTSPSTPRRGRPAATPTPATDEQQADPETGELPPAAEPPAESELAKQKTRVRMAAATLGIEPAMVNAIATEVTGKAKREDWIVLPTAVKKLADELERRVRDALDEIREPADTAGTE